MKIAIGVGGRFHADHMLHALIEGGYPTQLYTSLPKSRFPLHHDSIQSLVLPEVFFRLGRLIHLESLGDALKIHKFAKTLSSKLKKTQAPPELFIGWSSFSLETLRNRPASRHILMRDSSHIDYQFDLLREEYARYGLSLPNREFVRLREREEYQLADHIFVLSHFAKRSFVERQIPEEKISILRLGVDTLRFTPSPQVTALRPLRLLYFGTLNFRKGIQYLLEATKAFSSTELSLSLLGPVEPEFRALLSHYPHVTHISKQPQERMAQLIRNHHVFVLPTIEDGFGMTLFQAMASGLVPITTTHCGAGEMLEHGKDGFIVPPQNVEALRELISRLVKKPEELEEVRKQALLKVQEVTWEAYSDQLRGLIVQQLPYLNSKESKNFCVSRP